MDKYHFDEFQVWCGEKGIEITDTVYADAPDDAAWRTYWECWKAAIDVNQI